MIVERICGYVDRIIDNEGYLVFELPDCKEMNTIERKIPLSDLKKIGADRQGTLLELSVEIIGDTKKVRLLNLEKRTHRTWRDKIKDKDLEKYNLLKRFAKRPKDRKL